MMDWDDLRIFLQLVRNGQMTTAGKVLGVDDSTVGRRVARLEKALGVPLIERAGRRTAITEQGEKVAAAAEQIEAVILRKIVGIGEDPKFVMGRVRVGAPEGLGVGYLAQRLAEISALNEHLETELVALPRAYSLAAREVDIAITLERPSAGQVIVRKLTDYSLELYGTERYFERRGKPETIEDLTQHTFVGYIPELLFTEELNFSKVGHGEIVVPTIRSTSVIAQVNAIRSGAAIGVLPRFLAAAHADLKLLLSNELHLVRSYWIAVHNDLWHLHRIRTVLKAITAVARNDLSLFMRQ